MSFSRNRLGLTAATVAVVAAATLVFTAPWSSSPGFLGRVQAAVAPPPGSILHVKWELTSTSSDLACTVTYGPNEIWIDQTPPHRYRVFLNELNLGGADLRALACSRGEVAEFGGKFDPGRKARRPTLRFVPPNTLSATFANWPFLFLGPAQRSREGIIRGRRASIPAPVTSASITAEDVLAEVVPVDPVEDLRTGLSSGRAHDEGTVQIDGRTVERIRIDPPSYCAVSSCPRKPIYAYVDPETYYPVQIECEDCGAIALPGRPVLRLHMVTRFLTYEPLLSRTAANLALTNIQAQHPGATRSREPVLHLPTLSGAVAKTVRAAKGAKGARVTFEVTATAGDGGDIPVSCLPRSGSRFPLGETIVHCEASDAGGSTNTAEFSVTVKRRR